MSNSSIKLSNKNVYTIDITNESDEVIHTLKFHINDANFPIKLMNLFDRANKEIEILNEEEERLKKKILDEGLTEVPEIENVTAENIENMNIELSDATREFYMFQAKEYIKIREVLDELCGKGTCEAIFGEYNDKDMFMDFLDGLLPEFEKMGVKITNIQKTMYQKYAPKNKKVI